MDSISYMGGCIYETPYHGRPASIPLSASCCGGSCGWRKWNTSRPKGEHHAVFLCFSSEGMARESESTLYFNDGFGRMTEFHMTSDNHVMTLTIRQNMRIMWKGSCHVDRDTFSVVRREGQGHVYFLITLGEHTYHGEINRDDRWDVHEVKGFPGGM